MSFSSDVKENLSKISNFNKDFLQAEFIGYMLSGNTIETDEYIEFITENEFCIECLYKILFNLSIKYEPDIRGKLYVAQIDKSHARNVLEHYNEYIKGDLAKKFIKGVFLGSGSVNNPEKNYHLEIIFYNKENAIIVLEICKKYGINFKIIAVNNKYQIYLKDGGEISTFLALIGASSSVLKFEDVRVMKEMKNNINRKVNCETANLGKTIDAAIKQIEDIKLIKQKRKFNDLSAELKEIANLRIENPELSLKDLSVLVNPQVGKSTINRRLKKIHEIAESLK